MRNNSTWARSRLSPTNWPPDAWNISLTILALFGAFFFAVAPGVAYLSFLVALHRFDPAHPAPDQFLIAQIVSYLPLGAYLLVVIPALSRRSLAALGFRRPGPRDIAIGLGGAVVMWLAVGVAGSLLADLTHRHDTEAAVALLQQMKTPLEKLVFASVAVVLAPMIEELGFRLFIFNALTRYVSVWPAAILSGLVFGLIHSTGPAQFATVGIPLACGGVVLAYVYAKTRCYWSNVLTHALFNTVSVIAIFYFHAT